MNIREDRSFGGHAAMIVANICFGINMTISKMVLNSSFIGSLDIVLLRMLGGAMLFWFASLFVRRDPLQRGDMLRFFFASIFGVVVNQMLFIHGLSLTSPINGSIIVTMTPIFTMILAALLLREPITLKKAGGVVLGAAGALFLILSISSAAGERGHFSGDILIILSGMCFAVYLAAFRDLVRRYHAVTVMKWLFLFGLVCSLPIGAGGLMRIPWGEIPTGQWLELGYVVLIATFFAYMLIPIGQHNLRPTVVSMYNYTQPVVGSLFAVSMGLDGLTWQKVVAAAMIFTGVYITSISKSRAQLEAGKGK